MFKFMQKKSKDQSGMTLIEMIVVIALIGVFLAAVAIMVSKGRRASVEGRVAQEIDMIQSGIGELKMYKGYSPAKTTATAISAVTELAPYVPGEVADWKYTCAAGAANPITLEMPVRLQFDNLGDAQKAGAKLIDQGVCASTGVVSGTTQITCQLMQFQATNCQ